MVTVTTYVGIEPVLLIMGYIINWAILLKMGKQKIPFWNFLGGALFALLGYASMVVLEDNLNNVLGFLLLLIGVIAMLYLWIKAISAMLSK